MRHVRLLLLSFLAVLAGQAAQRDSIIIDLAPFLFASTPTLKEVIKGIGKKVRIKSGEWKLGAFKREGNSRRLLKGTQLNTKIGNAVEKVGCFRLYAPGTKGAQINNPQLGLGQVEVEFEVEAQLPLESVGLNKESEVQKLINSLQEKEFSVTAVQWMRKDSKNKWGVIGEEDGAAVEDCKINELLKKGKNRLRIQLLGPNAGKKEKKEKKVSSSPATPSWLDKLGKGLLCVAIVGGGFLVFKQLFKKPRPAKRRK